MLINMIMAYARSFGEREEGQGLVEYALILSLVSVAAIAGLTLLGGNIQTLLDGVANTIVPGGGG